MRLANVRFICNKRRIRNLVILSVSFGLLLNLLILTFNEKPSPHSVQQTIITRSNDKRIHTKLRQKISCPTKSPLLILVSSNLEHFDRRNLIRNTWGPDNSLLQRWRTVFLLTDDGDDKHQNISRAENELYGDLITGSYKESFFNMAFKVAMGFEWAVKFCKFDFLLKTDDDIFVNTHGLLDYLNEPSTPKKLLYTGNPMIGSPVLREGRYAVQYQRGETRDDQLNKTMFAPYCSGGGFLLSADVVSTLLNLFDLEHPLNIDDAYIGELAERGHVKVIVNGKNFQMYSDSCKYNTEAFVQHPAKGECLRELHRQHVKYIMTGELETPPPTTPPTQPPTKTPTTPALAIQQLFKSSSIPGNTSSDRPSSIPGNKLSDRPSSIPGNKLSDRPSSIPGNKPSDRPSSIPGNKLSDRPSSIPGKKLSDRPSSIPGKKPSSIPGKKPSDRPSSIPGKKPSSIPGKKPSDRPSSIPGKKPSDRPSSIPGKKPSDRPSSIPVFQAINHHDRPSSIPGNKPSDRPSSKLDRVGSSDRPSKQIADPPKSKGLKRSN